MLNAKVGDTHIENRVEPWGFGEGNEHGKRPVEWCREQFHDFEYLL